MKTISAVLLSAVALSPLLAHAADTNWYAVVSAGQSTYDVDKSDFDVDGFQSRSSKLDDNDTGYKIQVGYKFNDNLAVEGGYVDLGRMTYSATLDNNNPRASEVGPAAAELKAYGFNVEAVGILPVGAGFSVFAKGGAIIAHTESDAQITLSRFSTGTPAGTVSGDSHKTETSFKPAAGVGIAFDLNETLTARIEYERFFSLKTDADDVDVDLASIGLVARF